jgi:hypothetical protein
LPTSNTKEQDSSPQVGPKTCIIKNFIIILTALQSTESILGSELLPWEHLRLVSPEVTAGINQSRACSNPRATAFLNLLQPCTKSPSPLQSRQRLFTGRTGCRQSVKAQGNGTQSNDAQAIILHSCLPSQRQHGACVLLCAWAEWGATISLELSSPKSQVDGMASGYRE